MANTHGLNGSLAIDLAGGTSYTSIGDLTDLDINFEQDVVDITNKDGAGFKEHVLGHRKATITGSFIWNDGSSQDAGQEDLIDAWENQTTFTYRFRLESTTGAEQYTGSASVVNVQPSSPNTDANQASFTIETTGAITRAAQ